MPQSVPSVSILSPFKSVLIFTMCFSVINYFIILLSLSVDFNTEMRGLQLKEISCGLIEFEGEKLNSVRREHCVEEP